MDDIEIQIFDEINDYKEKFGQFTFRQILFGILIVVVVVPTYIFLSDAIGDNVTSYVVILEAAILGFIGFIKINGLPAEKIIPYWYRHYFKFAKPIKYMTTDEYNKMLEDKKHHKKAIETIDKETAESLSPKELKKLQKQERDLEKARKKYGKRFDTEVNNNIEETVIEPTQEKTEVSVDERKSNDDASEEPTENTSSEDKEKSLETDEINRRLESMTDEEKKVLLKLLGK